MSKDKHIVIGIEGEVSSGKTSICNELINKINNAVFLDGGAIYRGLVMAVKKNKAKLVWIFLKNKILKLFGKKGLDAYELMKDLKVEFKIEDKKTAIYIDNKKIDEKEIHTLNNDMGVSKMAGKVNNEVIYKFAKELVDKYRKKYNLILSARDLINIYPDMTCFVYVTCDLKERVNRRYSQFEGKVSKKDLKEYITKRDELHKQSFQTEGFERTINVDVTKCKNAEESTDLVIKKMLEKNYIDSSILKGE